MSSNVDSKIKIKRHTHTHISGLEFQIIAKGKDILGFQRNFNFLLDNI